MGTRAVARVMTRRGRAFPKSVCGNRNNRAEGPARWLMEKSDTKSVQLTCSGHLTAAIARAERGKAERRNRVQLALLLHGRMLRPSEGGECPPRKVRLAI